MDRDIFASHTFADLESTMHKTIDKRKGFEIDVNPDIEVIETVKNKPNFKKQKPTPMTSDEIRTQIAVRQQRERNRLMAEKLSPVAKYKEYIRRNKVRGMQRRKFSLIMGIPTGKKFRNLGSMQNDVTHQVFSFRNEVQIAAEELGGDHTYYTPSVTQVNFMPADSRWLRLKTYI